ncbi:MAG: hypothetical protein ACW99Q_23275, partial [Candidatus Kariarchaeaceae archaeon]
TYERDAFLTVNTIESDDLSGTVSNPTDTMNFKLGTEPAFATSFSGVKKTYQLGAQEMAYESLTSSLFVLTGEGSNTGTNISISNPFASPLGSHIVAGMSKATMDGVNDNLSWKYIEAFIITSYPTWDGDSIIHDPEYTVEFKASETSKSDKDSGDFPVIAFFLSSIFISTITFYRKRKKI